jgi:hypothetical protein
MVGFGLAGVAAAADAGNDSFGSLRESENAAEAGRGLPMRGDFKKAILRRSELSVG